MTYDDASRAARIHLFTSNSQPQSSKTGSMLRRLLVVPTTAAVTAAARLRVRLATSTLLPSQQRRLLSSSGDGGAADAQSAESAVREGRMRALLEETLQPTHLVIQDISGACLLCVLCVVCVVVWFWWGLGREMCVGGRASFGLLNDGFLFFLFFFLNWGCRRVWGNVQHGGGVPALQG